MYYYALLFFILQNTRERKSEIRQIWEPFSHKNRICAIAWCMGEKTYQFFCNKALDCS